MRQAGACPSLHTHSRDYIPQLARDNADCYALSCERRLNRQVGLTYLAALPITGLSASVRDRYDLKGFTDLTINNAKRKIYVKGNVWYREGELAFA